MDAMPGSWYKPRVGDQVRAVNRLTENSPGINSHMEEFFDSGDWYTIRKVVEGRGTVGLELEGIDEGMWWYLLADLDFRHGKGDTDPVREAIQGSIRKWEDIITGKARDKGFANCPLCEKFFRCRYEGCPVSRKTGETNCRKTPYETWCSHHKFAHRTQIRKTIHCPDCAGLALDEIKFLKEVLRDYDNGELSDAPRRKPQYKLKLDNPDGIVGQDTIRLKLMDAETGESVPAPWVLTINPDGTLYRYTGVNPDCGLALNDFGIIIEES